MDRVQQLYSFKPGEFVESKDQEGGSKYSLPCLNLVITMVIAQRLNQLFL